MNSTYLGYLFTILSAFAFASTSLFAKLAYGAGMDPWNYTFVTSVFSLALLGAMSVREPRTPTTEERPGWGSLLLFGICGAGAAMAFNLALDMLSISLATILLFTYPAFVALGAWLLLGQRPAALHVGALFMTLVGAALTTNLQEVATGVHNLAGLALALLAAVSHGMYLVLGERVSHGISAVGATTLTRLVLLASTVLFHPSVLLELGGITWQGWLICLVATAVAGVAPFLFLNKGIALIGANRVAITSVAELPFALALGLIFQGDVILPLQWAGAVLITAAVMISQYQTNPKEGSPHGPGPGTA